MNQKVIEFHAELRKAAAEGQRHCYITRAKEFQIEAIEKLEEALKQAGALKAEFISDEDEDSANAMLSFEKILSAIVTELNMWVALKNDDPGAAWDFLANAEVSARSSLSVHPIGEQLNCEGYLRHLEILEHTLFPPLMFFSVGVIVDEAVCSICGQEYGECDHIKGRAYMGQECVRIIKHARMLEASVVDKPANKHARVTGMTDTEGVFRDILTWRAIPRHSPEPEPEQEQSIEG